jgi:Recombination, repair and ssDNA binding protein UvsY
MTLKYYQSVVPKDLSFDRSELDSEAERTAQIHNKYLVFLLDETTQLETMRRAYDSLWHQQTLYYLGKAEDKVYKEKPFDFKVRPIKSEVEQWLKADPDIQSADAAIKAQEKVVKYLTDTLRQINSRGYDIKAMIEWIRFKNGLSNRNEQLQSQQI